MSFDPDKYLAEKTASAGEFNPDRYLAEKLGGGGPGTLEAAGRGAVHGATAGFADELAGLGATMQESLRRQPELAGVPDAELYAAGAPGADAVAEGRRTRDEYRAEDDTSKKAHPVAFGAGDVAGGVATAAMLPGGATSTLLRAAGTGAGMGALSAAGDSRAETLPELAIDTGAGAVTGAAGGAGGFGVGKLIAGAGRALGGAAQAAERRFVQLLGDKAAKEAEARAASAAGSYGAARADASRILEVLQRPTGDAAQDVANKAILAGPEGKRLLVEVARGAADRAPNALAQVDAQKALMQAAQAEVPAARAAGETVEHAKTQLVERGKAQAERYAIPAVAAAVGAAVGGPVGAGIGAAAGRGVSPPAVRAVVGNLALSPEAKRIAAGTAVTALQRIAQSNPGKLGKYAAILVPALRQGQKEFDAHSYVLGQTDPEFQRLKHELDAEDANGQ